LSSPACLLHLYILVMKIVLAIVLALCLNLNAFAQNRKVIVKQIERFRDTELYNASYNIEQDSLKELIRQFFRLNNYRAISASDSVMRFYLRKSTIGVRRGVSHASANNRRGRYVRCRIHVYVRVSIMEEEDGKKIIVSSEAVNYTVNASTNIYTWGGSHRFDELSLRTFLYISCVGNAMPMPPELYAMVNNYNSNQTRERKKIIQGRHY